MDNVTHTLTGFVAADLALRFRERRGASVVHWARPAHLTSALANNFPDLDFVYSGITEGPLGYLLHHRGHTHTLALSPLMAALAFFAGFLWLRRSPSAGPADRLWLAGLALFGAVLHIAMDGSNSYGVHPFWPLSGDWFYGDSIFIVEPLFWALTLPALFFQVRWKPGRVVLALLFALVLVLAWATGFVPVPLAVAFTLIAAASVLVTRLLAPERRSLFALGGSLVVVAAFTLSSLAAERSARAELAHGFPAATTHDVAMSPLPANPFCWTLLAVQTEGENYVVRRGVFALAPGVFDVARCPSMRGDNPSAPLAPVPVTSERVRYSGQFVTPLAQLRALARDHCVFRALLRFARVPYVVDRGGELWAGDLRYDRSPELEFAELSTERQPARCPRFVPGWNPPRRELVD